ncbi:MAG: acyltransferase domain-containing protein [Mobilitalea sp.]
MTILELCKLINLQPDVTNDVVAFYNSPDFELIGKQLNEVNDLDSVDNDAILRLYGLFSPDERQVKMLTYMLHRALEAYENYMQLGISEDIYIATMKCFTRFIEESYVKNGAHVFDRGWWTVRQISVKLFRIGELEYELINWNDEPTISIHIPSDANLSREKCVESLKLAKDFMVKYFPEYANSKYICDSWLLSPTLKELLPNTSNIIGFQNMFDIVETKPDSMAFVEWVFKQDTSNIVRTAPNELGITEMVYQKRDINIDEMPENTSLQKKIKAYVKAEGSIGETLGILKTI